jgi:hypothetical protein
MKILIKYILIILSISQSIKSQNFNNASASIEQAFFQLNKLAISTNLLKDSTNNGQLSIESLKFGFDDIAINNVDNEAINMIINGPNIFLDHFEFSTKYKLPNFYMIMGSMPFG